MCDSAADLHKRCCMLCYGQAKQTSGCWLKGLLCLGCVAVQIIIACLFGRAGAGRRMLGVLPAVFCGAIRPSYCQVG
jgi:hypothetical protein